MMFMVLVVRAGSVMGQVSGVAAYDREPQVSIGGGVGGIRVPSVFS